MDQEKESERKTYVSALASVQDVKTSRYAESRRLRYACEKKQQGGIGSVVLSY